MKSFDATLALGSNLGDRVRNIEEAIARLTADGTVELVARSRLYRTAPWGVTDQDWFVNACIAIKTGLSPRELLHHCQAVENGMGRVRTKRWGPRNIDVDILTFGGSQSARGGPEHSASADCGASVRFDSAEGHRAGFAN